MRIPISCHECIWTDIENESASAEGAQAEDASSTPDTGWGRPPNPDHWYLADIEEDNAYVATCRHGHTMRMTLQATRYELLYESGIVATLIGFHREAVSSIAASLERFFEFSTQVFTTRCGLDEPTHDEAWKLVKKSTERQLGGFALLFLANTGHPFLRGAKHRTFEEWTAFRNNVIHQGYFPSATKTLDYARYVFELIHETRTTLTTLDAAAVDKVQMRHYHQGHQAVSDKAGPPLPDKNGLYRSASSASIQMMLGGLNPDAPTDFESRLAGAQTRMSWWGFPQYCPPEPQQPNLVSSKASG